MARRIGLCAFGGVLIVAACAGASAPACASRGSVAAETSAAYSSFCDKDAALEALLARMYGAHWSTARLPGKAADAAAWSQRIHASLGTTLHDLDADGDKVGFERRQVNDDQDLLDSDNRALNAQVDSLKSDVDTYNAEVDRYEATVQRHNASPPDPHDAGAVAAYNREKAELDAWMQRLGSRRSALNDRESDLNARLNRLQQRQADIEQRRASVEQKEADQRAHETSLRDACNEACVQIDKATEDLTRMSERAAETVHALDDVAHHFTSRSHPQHGLALGSVAQRRREQRLEALNCRDFFKQMGAELARTNPAAKSWAQDFGGMTATQIVHKLSALSDSGSGQWTRVAAEKAQELANAGGIVVGGTLPGAGEAHGHLGFVSPVPVGMAGKFDGSGPFVRDGNEHDFSQNKNLPSGQQKVYPSTYGAVHASRAFHGPVTWFVWKPSVAE